MEIKHMKKNVAHAEEQGTKTNDVVCPKCIGTGDIMLDDGFDVIPPSSGICPMCKGTGRYITKKYKLDKVSKKDIVK
jgi:DnaJ-class molecular chaperone